MIDTLDLILRQRDFPSVNFKDTISLLQARCENDTDFNFLSKRFDRTGKYNLHVQYHYKHDYHIHATEDCIRLNKCSLCKFIHGDNFPHTLSLNEAKAAIELLSDRLDLPIMQATVTRVDFGANIQVNQPVRAYVNRCAKFKRTEPVIFQHGINFYTEPQLALYDKKKEAKKKEIDGYFIRYELRIKKPTKSLDMKIVLVEDLLSSNTYSRLLDMWYDAFCQIQLKPITCSKILPERIEDLTSLKKECLLQVLSDDYEEIMTIIKIAHEENTLSDRNYSTIKKAIKELAPNSNDNSNSIEELRIKIKKIVEETKSQLLNEYI